MKHHIAPEPSIIETLLDVVPGELRDAYRPRPASGAPRPCAWCGHGAASHPNTGKRLARPCNRCDCDVFVDDS